MFPLPSQQVLLIWETREKLLRPQLVGFGNLRKILLAKGNIDDKGYWDSGCSRHMTGNISYLSVGSKALTPGADEPASPPRDDSHGEAFCSIHDIITQARDDGLATLS
ncbi:hypothetical protein Tco_1208423 [Tanacetum coccineum]